MKTPVRAALLLCAAPILLACSVQAQPVGATSYVTMPAFHTIAQISWGADVGWYPELLWWQKNAFYQNASNITASQIAAQNAENAGLIPYGTKVGGVGDYICSLSAAGEITIGDAGQQSYCSSNAAMYGQPDYQAWAAWIRARPGLIALANDGGTLPAAWRSWGGTSAWIPPFEAIADADCPVSKPHDCTYGDWAAYQYGQLAGLIGAPGSGLADYSANSLPADSSWTQPFNPAIVAAFAKWSGQAVPAGPVTTQSAWIAAHAMPAWNDYIARGFATYFRAVAAQIEAATKLAALITVDGYDYAGVNRFAGVDPRWYAKQGGLATRILITNDDQTISEAPGRPCTPLTQSLIGGAIIAAARTPEIREGALLVANGTAFRAGLAACLPGWSAADLAELGPKLLRRELLEYGWSHIANRGGRLRRGPAFFSAGYADNGNDSDGSFDPALVSLVQSIVPARPFGFGLYYSVSVERAVEATLTPTSGVPYLSPADLFAFRQAVPLNYYVSDLALPNLQPSAIPAAWVVLDAGGYLPASEMAALQATSAPIVTSVAQAQALPNAPLAFSSGLAGTGFWAHDGRLILTVTDPGTGENDPGVLGTITLRGLADGGYTLTDLLAGTTLASFASSGGIASVPIAVSRWDTLALAVSPAG